MKDNEDKKPEVNLDNEPKLDPDIDTALSQLATFASQQGGETSRIVGKCLDVFSLLFEAGHGGCVVQAFVDLMITHKQVLMDLLDKKHPGMRQATNQLLGHEVTPVTKADVDAFFSTNFQVGGFTGSISPFTSKSEEEVEGETDVPEGEQKETTKPRPQVFLSKRNNPHLS